MRRLILFRKEKWQPTKRKQPGPNFNAQHLSGALSGRRKLERLPQI
jgi:hypothetical protein